MQFPGTHDFNQPKATHGRSPEFAGHPEAPNPVRGGIVVERRSLLLFFIGAATERYNQRPNTGSPKPSHNTSVARRADEKQDRGFRVCHTYNDAAPDGAGAGTSNDHPPGGAWNELHVFLTEEPTRKQNQKPKTDRNK
jgi:hypothetical protein